MEKADFLINPPYWWKRIACELHQTNAKLALQRAAAARRALFRLPTGADDELQNDELQTDLPAEVADRIIVRTVIANGIPEMPGPPASARGTPVQLRR